ncbi:TVP38/TMEM64 family protein [Haloarchaeobius sp. TZWWS8]|uniref:TVP38/TMEM64 family protein n=1 Tax=Haloarchaeobius sp. TZWWS8 TaxID=3446121 RepID=UPI003EBC0D10
MRWDARRRAALGVLVVVAVVATSLFTSTAAVFARVEAVSNDPWLFGACLFVLYLCRPFLAWPTTLLAVAVGYGYGVLLGVPLGLAGAALTSVPVFAAARWVDGPDDAGRLLAGVPAVDGVRSSVEGYFDSAGDFRGVTAARLAPIPADAVTATAAVSGVRLSTFLAATVVGELPWTVAAVVVGSSASTLSASGLGAVGLPLAVAMVVSSGVLLAGPAYERFAGSSE